MGSLRFQAGAWLLALVVLAGCSSTPVAPQAPVEDRMGAGGKALPTAPGGAGGSGVGSGQISESRVTPIDTSRGLGAEAALGNNRIVYFDYDSYAVKDEYRSVIEANAKLLAANPNRRVQAEGHTDARGSSEYNLALGQRRADAVIKALTLLGARDSQLEAVSYGKERLAATGGDDAAHAKNRRVELRDR